MTSPPRLLMCKPDFYGIEYEINPWMNRLVVADSTVAARQWEALHQTLVDLGVEIDLIDPVKGLPDLVFTANAGLVCRSLFIPSKFRHEARQGEEPCFTAWAKSRGWEIVSVPGDHYFEGAGDALFCGETLFAGYRFRSDAFGHQWIGERLGVEVLPLELADPRFYHLDTCFCPISATQAIWYPGAFDDYGRDVLKSRVGELIEVSTEEAEHFACNAVVVGRTIILNEKTPRLAASLRQLGFDTKPHDLSEFLKAGGGAKCLTLRLDGEEAAYWRFQTAES
ncbi:dimethylarginine dimethylaminohydrolase family protein [Zavarzinella formosa]|uniref:dimethylarginine dimethylaminohydrolase family protein n=1 Tax=Zavarzinella formosa TaxID=360055 RepID=UPI0002ECAEBF|nr:arginine deiminase-related protein [Zavarzinella formosa]